VLLLGTFSPRAPTAGNAVSASETGAPWSRSQAARFDGETNLLVSVVAAESGAPLENVSLTIRPSSSPGPLFSRARSDGLGWAGLVVPTGQNLTLIAFARPRRNEMATLEVNALSGGEQREVRLSLRTGSEQGGTVRPPAGP